MAQFLLVRRDDLVHVGVQFVNFQLAPPAASGGTRPRLVAAAGAKITLTFPPQALCERDLLPGDPFFRLGAIRANTSTVQFAVPASTALELTAKGVFTALQAPGVTVVTDAPTAVEIPFRLLLRPVARAGGPVVCDLPVVPAASAAQVTGLWHARLRAASGDATDAGLAVVAIAALARTPPPDTTPDGFNPDDDFLEGDLKLGVRKQIVAQGGPGHPPAAARRLELSTIGGSLSVAGKWPGLEWSQEVILGRDNKIRTVVAGVLYPFGHRALLLTATRREFVRSSPATPHAAVAAGTIHHPPGNGSGDNPPDPPPHPPHPPHPVPASAMAGLQKVATLTIIEPLRRFTQDTAAGRQFPFREVEILQHTFENVDASPATASIIFPSAQQPPQPPPPPPRQPLPIPVRCGGANGDVVLHMPMLFVPDGQATSPAAAGRVWQGVRSLVAPGSAQTNPPSVPVALPGTAINMFPGSARPNDPRDIHEVHELAITAAVDGGGFHPTVVQFTAELPVLRTLLQMPSVSAPLAYTADYINRGDAADVALQVLGPGGVGIDFTAHPDRSGALIAPKYAANAISRTLGPVPNAVPFAQAFKDATLLGLPLVNLVQAAGFAPPTIVPLAGNPPGASMTWTVNLQPFGPFIPEGAGKATLTATVVPAPGQSVTTCKVDSFKFVLPPVGEALVTLHFGSVVFTAVPGQHPTLDITGLRLEFGGALLLLKDMLDELQNLIGPSRPTVRPLPAGISAGYSLAIPSVTSGDFVIKNVAANVEVDVPFTAGPVTVSLGFASRDNPFNLSVLALGGGGYISMQLGQNGTELSRFEASMEFGATVAVDFLIVKAEVHALGGVRFLAPSLELDAFIRIGGSVDLFGLVSVSIELQIVLGYQAATNALVGRATLVIDVDVTLFSESVTLDSGEWVLSGSKSAAVPSAPVTAAATAPELAGLTQYIKAFAA